MPGQVDGKWKGVRGQGCDEGTQQELGPQG